MQETYQRQQSDPISIALRQGFLFGIIMIGIYLFYTIVNRVTGFPERFLFTENVPSLAITYGIAGALALIAAVVFLICGISVARKTGRGSSGWIAGHFGGLIYGFGSFLIFCIAYFVFIFPSFKGIDPNLLISFIQSALSNQLLTVFFLGGVIAGNLAGAIGGLLGKGSSRARIGS